MGKFYRALIDQKKIMILNLNYKIQGWELINIIIEKLQDQ